MPACCGPRHLARLCIAVSACVSLAVAEAAAGDTPKRAQRHTPDDIDHSAVHHIGDLHLEEHVPRDSRRVHDMDPHHFTVTYGHPAKAGGPKGIVEVKAALGDSSDPHVVPVRSYVVWSTLDAIYSSAERRGWAVKKVALMQCHHKRAAPDTTELDEHDGDMTGSVFVIASADRREAWESALRKQGVAIKEAAAAAGLKLGKIGKINTRKYEVALADKRHVAKALDILSRLHEVRWVEPEFFGEPLNKVATCTVQSDMGALHPVWDQPSRLAGNNELILVGDTGLNVKSCFFADSKQEVAYYPKLNPKHRKILSYRACVDSASGDVDVDDAIGHGTHVTGSLVGSIESGGGDLKNYAGIANDAKVIFSDLNCAGKEQLNKLKIPQDLLQYFNISHALGGRISHNSWGFQKPKAVVSLDREADEFTWTHLDYVVIASAGNNIRVGVLSPAAAKNVLTVGAHKNSLDPKQRDVVAPAYAKGPTFDKRIKPEIMAPGYQDVSSASHQSQCALRKLQGTSMASPFVSGASAIIRQYFKEAWYPAGARGMGVSIEPTSSLVRALVVHSAHRMHGSNSDWKSGIPNNNQGWGQLAMHNVLYFNGRSPEKNQYPDNHLFIAYDKFMPQDGTYTIEFTAKDDAQSRAQGVRVTLAYTDYPAALGAKVSTINDLDLVVMKPDGTLVVGNAGGNIHRESTVYDRLNLIEQVDLPTAEPGKYRAIVYGYHVPEIGEYAGVPFSLVVTAPGIAARGVSSPAACPNGCSGQGTCLEHTGTCDCNEGYHHVDCSKCSSEIYCYGHGTCSVGGDKKVTCECEGPQFTGDRCDKCAKDLYGPKCDNNCACSGHGSCDTSLPAELRTCRCAGNWAGPKCAYCARGFAGDECKTVAHWCRLDGQPSVIRGERHGQIEINSWHHYDNSRHCDWAIKTPGIGWSIEIEFVYFKLERSYDWFWVYAGNAPTPGKHIHKFDGTSAMANGGKYSINGPAYLRFTADLIGESEGFLLKYTLKGSCEESLCGDHGYCERGDSRFLCGCTDNFDPASLCRTCLPGYSPPTCAPTPAPTAPRTNAPPDGSTGGNGCQPPGEFDSIQDCLGNGVCEHGSCACSTGYGGEFCQLLCPGMHFLPPSACQNGGVCRAAEAGVSTGTSTGVCECPVPHPGSRVQWGGDACQISVNRFHSDTAPVLQRYSMHSVASGRWSLGSVTRGNAGQSGWVRLLIRSHHGGAWLPDYQASRPDSRGASAKLHLAVWEERSTVGSTVNALWHRELNDVSCTLLKVREAEAVLGLYLEEPSQSSYALPLVVELAEVAAPEGGGAGGGEEEAALAECGDSSAQGGLSESHRLTQRFAVTDPPPPPTLQFAAPFASFSVLGFGVGCLLVVAYFFYTSRAARQKAAADAALKQSAQSRAEADEA